MVKEVLQLLKPKPSEVVVDCTLGYGGHAADLLPRLQPDGKLIGLDADPLEIGKTEFRLRGLGFAERIFTAVRSNFAGVTKVLGSLGIGRVDGIFADLGVSSMQLDDPARGFSSKFEGPLDMRMNPQRGEPASNLLRKLSPERLSILLVENADEPHASILASSLAGKLFGSTIELARAIRAALIHLNKEEQDAAIRRVFQALRIAVNNEFSALDSLLRAIPDVLNPGGRVVILTFHSGEDRRVKKAFAAGLRADTYSDISAEVVRPGPEERHDNPRSSSAKLRWAVRGTL
jgi:16S rRNA (cytosine1402-N4)-methyltransferase